MPSSRGSSRPRDQTRVSYELLQMGSLPLVPPGKALLSLTTYLFVYLEGEKSLLESLLEILLPFSHLPYCIHQHMSLFFVT